MPAGIDAKHEVIAGLIDDHITPLVVKKTMCSYLSIGWDNAVRQYKGCVRAAKARALDASACTVPRGFKRSRSDDAEENDGEGVGMGAGEDALENALEDAVAGPVDGAVAVEGDVEGEAGAETWEERAMQLCKLLRKPTEKGRAAFLKKSPAF